MPLELIAEALDQEQARFQNSWGVVPLIARSEHPEVLGLYGIENKLWQNKANILHPALEGVAGALAIAQTQIEERQRYKLREDRLRTMLELAKEWSQAQEVEPLLRHMAEASTRLLRADRASIFLWDKPNQQLVARPALGVPGNELRVPDSVGIVGRTLQTGRPQRVNLHDEGQGIYRDVDEQLGYTTRSLICVPLRAVLAS